MNSVPYVAVSKLVNSYVPVYFNGEVVTFLSDQPQCIFEEAQKFAIHCAKINKVILHDGLLNMVKPIMSVWKHNGKWYPAELHPESVKILTGNGTSDIGRPDTEMALHLAKQIASVQHLSFLPKIGLSVNQD